MKVAVLGASGMLGSMLVDYLSQHFEVVATTRNLEYSLLHASCNLVNVKWRYFQVPFTKHSLSNRALSSCDWVINAIGAIPQRMDNPKTLHAVNARFPHDLANICSLPIIQPR